MFHKWLMQFSEVHAMKQRQFVTTGKLPKRALRLREKIHQYCQENVVEKLEFMAVSSQKLEISGLGPQSQRS